MFHVQNSLTLMPRTSSEQKAASHRRILSVAAAQWGKRGPFNVTIPSAMASAGLTTGAFFRHFGSKDAFLSEVLQHGVADLLGKVERGEESVAEFLGNYASSEHIEARLPGCPIAAIGIFGEPEGSLVQRTLELAVRRFVAAMPAGDDPSNRRHQVETAALVIGWVMIHRWMNETPSSEDCVHLLQRAVGP